MSSLSFLCVLFLTFAVVFAIPTAYSEREKRESQPQVFRIPLRHESSSRNTWSKLKRAKRDTPMMGENSLASSASAPSKHHGLSTENDFYYYGVATVGTPGQEFRMYLDTGSADIWVPGSACNTRFCKTPGRRLFQESASRTLHQTAFEFNITYCDNTSATGTTAYDYVSMAGLTVYPQAIGIMKNVDDSSANLDKYDGIFGLSYPHYANPGTIPFVMNLILKNAIPSPVFSFWLNRDPKTTQQQGGELTLGGVNTDHFEEPMHYFPVSKLGDWGLQLNSLVANLPDGTKHDLSEECDGGCTAIIDTGTAYVVGPGIAELLDALEEAQIIQADANYTNVVECSRLSELPTLTFQFASQKPKLTLEPIHYTFPIDSKNGTCFRAVALDNETCSGDKYILGDSFLGKYYSTYDMGQNRIGLALSKHGSMNEVEKPAVEKPVEKASFKASQQAAIHAPATGKSPAVQSNAMFVVMLIALVTGLCNAYA